MSSQTSVRSHRRYARLFPLLFLFFFILVIGLIRITSTVLANNIIDPQIRNSDLVTSIANYAASATPINFDGTVSGNIGAPGDTVSYTINGTSGDIVEFRIHVTSGDLNPQIEVFSSAVSPLPICSADTIFAYLEMQCTLDVAGTYSILISARGGDTSGDFDLYLQSVVNPANTTALSFDVTQSGTISPTVEMDAFTLAGTAGDIVEFRERITSGNLHPQIEVYRPDGSLLCNADTIFAFLEMQCTLDVAGTYSILISARGGDTSGDFDLYLQSVVNPANTVALIFDVTQSSTISPTVEMDAFTLAGTAGDIVEFRERITSGNLHPQIEVYRPDGSLLCSADTIFAFLEMQCTLDVAGTYSILISARGGDTSGDFDLYLQSVVNPANTVALSFDVTQSGTISPTVEMDAFTLAGTAGDIVEFRERITSGNLHPQIEVYRPDGSLLCSADTIFAFLEMQCTLDVAGTYSILVSARGGDTSGDFDLYLQSVVNPANTTALSFDVTQSSTISPTVEMDAFTLAGTAGDLAEFNVWVTSGNLHPQIEVYRPDGSPVCNADTIFSSLKLQCTLDVTGTYHVLISARSGDTFGDFDLLVQIVSGGTATIEGTVALQGRSDHSGADVCADDGINQLCVKIGRGGAYSINVPEGSYSVTVDMERYLDAEKLNVPVTAGNVTSLQPVTCLGGDTNDDCVVNILDLALEGGRFGASCGDPTWDDRADINNDCTVNILDLAVTGGNFGETCPVPWS